MDDLQQFFENLGNVSSEYAGEELTDAKAKFGNLVQCLLKRITTGSTETFDQAFQVIEYHFIFGPDQLRDMILVNLLEELKNESCARDFDFAQFEPWLGPETHVAWRWLEKRWQGKESLAQAASRKSR